MNATRREELDFCLRAPVGRELRHLRGVPSSFAQINPYDAGRGAYRSELDEATATFEVTRNLRFTDVPAHYHNYLEMGYMYSGSCEVVIEGTPVTLRQGDLSVLDTNTVHQIGYTGEDDILINFIVTRGTMRGLLEKTVIANPLISPFLVHCLDELGRGPSYLMFRTGESDRLSGLIEEILYEGFIARPPNRDVMLTLFNVMLYDLQPTLDPKRSSGAIPKGDYLVFEALEYIRSHYLECTLEQTAREMGVGASYLTTLLKKKTGRSFKDIVLVHKMELAARLLETGDGSVEKVAQQCGYLNQTQFYRKFSQTYGCTPAVYRKAHAGGPAPAGRRGA